MPTMTINPQDLKDLQGDKVRFLTAEPVMASFTPGVLIPEHTFLNNHDLGILQLDGTDRITVHTVILF